MPENTSPVAVPLSDERKQELIEKWRAVLSGRTEPEYLTFPPKIVAMVEAAERELPIKISPAAHRRLLEEYALSYYYGGNVVVRLDTPKGCAVLAVGGDELLLFEGSVPPELSNRAYSTYPPPWDDGE